MITYLNKVKADFVHARGMSSHGLENTFIPMSLSSMAKPHPTLGGPFQGGQTGEQTGLHSEVACTLENPSRVSRVSTTGV
jgi:hypothetical protein